MKTTTNLNLWLNTTLYEKGISKDHTFEVSDGFFTHYIDLRTILDLITQTCVEEREYIYNNLVAIDFLGGSLLDYFYHLATVYIAA